LSLNALKRHAREVGVSAEALDDADDADDVKHAVTALILEGMQQQGAGSLEGADTPHSGSAPAPATTPIAKSQQSQSGPVTVAAKPPHPVAELGRLSLAELQEWARDAGVELEKNTTDSSSAVIEALLIHTFGGLRLQDLRERATWAGMQGDQLDRIMDSSDDPEEEIIWHFIKQAEQDARAGKEASMEPAPELEPELEPEPELELEPEPEPEPAPELKAEGLSRAQKARQRAVERAARKKAAAVAAAAAAASQ
jgi:hypothetical protein